MAEAPEDWSVLAEVFREFGIEGTVQFDKPPALGGYLVDSDIVKELSQSLIEGGANRIETESVEEVDWSSAWREFFKPRRVGINIVVHPSWEAYTANPDDIVIVLDPGQSFGTGDHPTTRLCLEMLEREVVSGMGAADIGCGSGILTIALSKLGAKRIVAVDTEPLAVEATLENLKRNQAHAEVTQSKGFTNIESNQTFNLIVSNIISAAIIALTPDVKSRLREDGVWIVSGIICDNWPDVKRTVEVHGFSVSYQQEEDGWVAAVLSR